MYTVAPSRRELERRAAALLARSNAPVAPAVVWQGAREALGAFNTRMEQARADLPRSVRLLAVCEPNDAPPAGVDVVAFTAPLFRLLHPLQAAPLLCQWRPWLPRSRQLQRAGNPESTRPRAPEANSRSRFITRKRAPLGSFIALLQGFACKPYAFPVG